MVHVRDSDWLRRVFTAAVVILGLAALAVILWIAKLALELRALLATQPTWIWILFGAAVTALALFSLWLMLRLFRRPRPASAPVFDADTVDQRIAQARALGMDTSAAEAELQRLQSAPPDTFQVALFGGVNTGKSSLIRALIPDAQVQIGVLAGSTREITRYHWEAAPGLHLEMIDLPGGDSHGYGLGKAVVDEMRRAHIIIYVCDDDLTASRWRMLEQVIALNSAIIVAISKTDRIADASADRVRARLAAHPKGPSIRVVAVCPGGRRRVITRDADQSESSSWETLPVQVDGLVACLQDLIRSEHVALHQAREQALFALAIDKLQAGLRARRLQEGERIVQRFSRRAIIGALAALAPGSDLLIQGVLAVQLLRKLGALYNVPLGQIDLDRFLQAANGRIRTTTSVSLAIAGNALKAFPGMGTITGGLVHAVAYALIFDSLGRTANQLLATRGELVFSATVLEDALHEDIQSRAKTLVQTALELAPDPARK